MTSAPPQPARSERERPSPTKPLRPLRSAAIVTAGQIVSYGCSFVRNLILARLLTKADFGLAAAFSMTISLLELAGRMSFGAQIVQTRDGDRPEFVASAHTFQFLLSLISAVLILILCAPLAAAFKVPDATWAFATLALSPFLGSLAHLDFMVRQRQLEFLPAALIEAVPQIVMTIVAWPLAVWLGDFRVILWLMVGKAALSVLMSHLMAQRSYRWSFDRAIMRSMFTFSWPLLLNGLLMFGSQQADQLLVGTFLSLEQLAMYSVSFSLVSIPWFIFARVTSQLMLPVLSRSQDDAPRFQRQYQLCVETATFASVMVLAPLIAAGEELITILYGAKYSGAGMIVAVLGVTSGFRFLRLAPAIAAISRSDTKNQLFSNIWRNASLPLALGAAVLGGNVLTIATCALGGELMASVFSILRLQKRCGIPAREHLPSVVVLAVALGTAAGIAFTITVWSLGTAVMIIVGVWLLGLGLTKVLLPGTYATLRSTAGGALHRVRLRLRPS